MFRRRPLSFLDVCRQCHAEHLKTLGFDFASDGDRDVIMENPHCRLHIYSGGPQVEMILYNLHQPEDPAPMRTYGIEGGSEGLPRRPNDRTQYYSVSLTTALEALHPDEVLLGEFPLNINGRHVEDDIRRCYALAATHCGPLLTGDDSAWQVVEEGRRQASDLAKHGSALVKKAVGSPDAYDEIVALVERYYLRRNFHTAGHLLTDLAKTMELPPRERVLMKWSNRAFWKRWNPPPLAAAEEAAKGTWLSRLFHSS